MRLNLPNPGHGSKRVFVSDTLYKIDTGDELVPNDDYCLMRRAAIERLQSELREAENTAAIANDVLAGATDARRSAFWSGCFWGAIGFGVLAALLLAARGMIG